MQHAPKRTAQSKRPSLSRDEEVESTQRNLRERRCGGQATSIAPGGITGRCHSGAHPRPPDLGRDAVPKNGCFHPENPPSPTACTLEEVGPPPLASGRSLHDREGGGGASRSNRVDRPRREKFDIEEARFDHLDQKTAPPKNRPLRCQGKSSARTPGCFLLRSRGPADIAVSRPFSLLIVRLATSMG